MNEFCDLYVSNDSLMMQVKEIIYFGPFLCQSNNRLTEIDTSIHLLFSFLISICFANVFNEGHKANIVCQTNSTIETCKFR